MSHNKPIISFQANQVVPLTQQLNTSIIRKKVSKTEYRNWDSKTELTDFVDTIYKPPTSDCYIFVKCQCGKEYEYIDKTEVPSENLTCTCGRKILQYNT